MAIMDDEDEEGNPSLTINPSQLAAAVATRTEAVLSQIQSDVNLKEELVHQIETGKQEYLAMKQRFEERQKFLQENLMATQKERDAALNGSRANPSLVNEISRMTRQKYEEKIKKLGKEVNELKEKLIELNRTTGAKTAANDCLIKNLRTSVQAIKSERNRLASKLDDETVKLRTDCQGHEQEIKELRQRERRSDEAARKWKKNFEFQKSLLQRKIDQYFQAKSKIKTLLNVLRKQRLSCSISSPSLGGLNLESPSWKRIQMSASPLKFSKLGSESVIVSDDDNVVEGEIVCGLTLGEDGDIIMASPSFPPSQSRRPSLEPASKAPPGESLPRSVLRMSPLIPKRRDFFSRIADAASLSIASEKLKGPKISKSNESVE